MSSKKNNSGIAKKKHTSRYEIGQPIDIPDKATRDRMFEEIDSSGDGELSLDEAKLALKVLYKDSTLAPQLEKAFVTADESKDGGVQEQEFRTLLRLVSYCPGPLQGWLGALSVLHSKSPLYSTFLYERAGRLTALVCGFRPGQTTRNGTYSVQLKRNAMAV